MKRGTSTVERHLAAIQSGKVTKSNIIGIRKALNAQWRNTVGYSVSATAPHWSISDSRAIIDALCRYRPSVLGESHDQGLAKLRDKRNARYLSERALIIIACPYLRFELVDFQDVARGQFQPVFRAIGNGESFDYISLSWQAIAYSRDDSLTPIIITE